MTGGRPAFARSGGLVDWTASSARWALRTSRLDGLADAVVRGALSRAQAASLWPATAALGCCSLQSLSVRGPRWDPERLGAVFCDEPEGCDVLLVDGPLTRANRGELPRLLARMAEPRWVMAIGSCAVGGGVFKGGHAVLGGVDSEVLVDVYVPGCPPTAEAVLLGLVKLGELVRRRAGPYLVVPREEGGLL
jgi:NADH:ubiquinone oxidoreductase subunit B-like Fe-S oxidoreductase